MKNTIIFLIAVLLLTSCILSSDAECAKGVCIDVGFKGRIQEWGPATVVITVQSDHDISGVKVSLNPFPGMKIIRSLSAPEGAELISQSERNCVWQFDALGNVEYTITAEVEISPPIYTVIEEGDTAQYDIQASTQFPGIDFLVNQYSMHLDHLGREIKSGKTYGAEAPAYEPKTTITIMPGETTVNEPTPITPTPDPYLIATPSTVNYPVPPATAPETSPTEMVEPAAYP